jgi:hypothetical protein
MKKRLIDKIAEQLKESNPSMLIEVDSFSDGSASWIEIKPKVMDINKGFFYLQVLSFNGKGSKLEEVSTYKETFVIDSDQEKLI